MTRINVMDARRTFSKTVNRVAFGRERIVLERRGEDVAAIVPVEDLVLLEEMEDRMDVEAAREALKERDSVSLEELKTKLGL